jgi:putative NADH-flavin reductase
MKIIVFGPTGGTGQELLRQAIAAGHEVTAFARNPQTIETRGQLKVVAGDVFDAAAVERAIAGHDAVLSALGGRPWRRTEVCSRAIRNITGGMSWHGVRRIIAISTFGAGETRTHVGWLARHALFGIVLRTEVADKEAMENALAASNLDWVVVRIGVLSGDTPRGEWRAADDGSIRGMGKIARADVAAFMLAQLERDTWLRRKPVIQY